MSSPSPPPSPLPSPPPSPPPPSSPPSNTLDARAIQSLQDLVKLQKTSTALSKKMAIELTQLQKTTEDLKNLQKKSTYLFIGLVVIIVLYIGLKLIHVYFKYKELISYCNQARSVSSEYWPAGGFATALSVEYPVLAGWFGFYNKQLPLAAYFVVYDPADFGANQSGSGTYGPDGQFTCQDLQSNVVDVLYVMYQYTLVGSGTTETQDLDVHDIICESFGNGCNQICHNQNCQGLGTSDWLAIGMSGIGGIGNGIATAHGFGMGTGGSLAITAATSIITVGLNYWQKEAQNQAQQDAAGCNGSITY